MFEVVTYDASYHLFLLLFAHSVGSEWLETCFHVFTFAARLSCFHTDDRTAIVDEEKAIDAAYRETVSEAQLFLDPFHVKTYMTTLLGRNKASSVYMYDATVHAPSRKAVDKLIGSYAAPRAGYLENAIRESYTGHTRRYRIRLQRPSGQSAKYLRLYAIRSVPWSRRKCCRK